jgi:hypothetical protein
MEPTTTPQTPPGPPVVGQSLVENIRTNRQNAGKAFLALAALLLGAAGFLAYKAYRSPEKSPDKPPTEKAEREPPKSTAETEAQSLNSSQYTVGWTASLLAGLVVAACGAWLLAWPPTGSESEQRSEIRTLLLAAGGLLGTITIVVGFALFYLWSDSLTNWLSKGETKEARWVLIPLLILILGTGLVFVAVQPARADERNNQSTRKLVYGANLALTVLLLLVGLVTANIVFARNVPSKLDTTETGFYSLSNTTRSLLTRLSEPVIAYAILPDGPDRISNDIRELLIACEDASGGKFHVKFLSPTANKVELEALKTKFKQLPLVLSQGVMEDEVRGAVVLATGENEMRNAVIPAREFMDTQGPQPVFQGEARLFKEIAFLADSQNRPVIYFTQGNGELNVEPGAKVEPVRSATALRTYLEGNYLTVRPLTLTGDNPTVPDDATVVVIADPVNPIPNPALTAIRNYIKKKGKLIVLAGATAGVDRKMVKTGLEPILAEELNVRLGMRFLFTLGTEQMPYVDGAIAAFSAEAEQNPILQAIARVNPQMLFFNAREVEPLPPNPTNPSVKAIELMHTAVLSTWLEDEEPTDLKATIQNMLQTAKAQQDKGLSRQARPLAAIVSEGQTGRAVVIGSAQFVSDEMIRQFRKRLPLDLIGVSIDWLRDKPSIAAAGIESKKYGEYRFPLPTSVDESRLKTLPLGLAILFVVGFGATVWVVRRK